MGVIYKLRPEIRDYILGQKRADPNLSCRGLISLVENRFQIKISKSSVNNLFKEAGLSMPVGRRQKIKKRRLGKVLVKSPIKGRIDQPVPLMIEPPVTALPKPQKETPLKEPVEPPVEKPPELHPEPVLEKAAEKPGEPLPEKPAVAPVEPYQDTESKEPPAVSPEPLRGEPVKQEPGEAAKIDLPKEGSVEKPVEPTPKEPPATPTGVSLEAKVPEVQESAVRPQKETPLKEPVEPPVEKPPELHPEPVLEKAAEKPGEPLPEKPVSAPKELPIETLPEIFTLKAEDWPEKSNSGAILLKAADALMGGSSHIAELINKRLNQQGNDISAKTESLIYLPLFVPSEAGYLENLNSIWSLIGKKFSTEDIKSYLAALQDVNGLYAEIYLLIASINQEVRAVEVVLSDGNTLYLDGQLHTIWSTPYVPFDFATTAHNIREGIKKYFSEDTPFIIFMAPGYEAPNKEFLNFTMNLNSPQKGITRLILYNNKLERLDIIELKNVQTKYFIFGVWPWQFTENRQVKKIGVFKEFVLKKCKKRVYLAEAEIELSQPITKQRDTLKGCALKFNLTDKTRLLILSNMSVDVTRLGELADLYLYRWPNLEETFQDYSRKIELFTYTADAQRFFPSESIAFDEGLRGNISGLFGYYMKLLDLYVKWHFLPHGYEDKDLSTINERFYKLSAVCDPQEDCVLVKFSLSPGYKFLSDLEYACRRINERGIIFPGGKKLRVEVSV